MCRTEHLSAEHTIGEHFDDDLTGLADKDMRRVGERHVDAHLDALFRRTVLACVGQKVGERTAQGATVDLLNNSPLFNDRPIGAQYCIAEPNSSGDTGWIRAMGPDQSVGSTKRLVAVDLPVNAFGYLLVLAYGAAFAAHRLVAALGGAA